MKKPLSFVLNGRRTDLEVEPHWTLLHLLREICGLTGTKEGCSKGECGACTVVVNGSALVSCILPCLEVDGAVVETIEGLSQGFPEAGHPIQQAFVQEGAVQCGFCTPGMIMSAKALLDEKPVPTKDEIRNAVEGNLCRCGSYVQILKAIEAAARKRIP
jgi:carbon-monoxide dehydrogenase small subunit